MSTDKASFSRYFINRGLTTLWKGDAAEPGASFRSIVLTSPDFNSTSGPFQVLALEGTGAGVKDGRFAGTQGTTKVLFDEDRDGAEKAAEQYKALIEAAEAEGFSVVTIWDEIEFENKARQSLSR